MGKRTGAKARHRAPCRLTCDSRVGLQAHHIVHWIDSGRTDLDNLVLLCAAHHRAHHDGEFDIVALGGAGLRFVRADGRELAAHTDPSQLADTDEPVEHQHGSIAPDAPTTRWDGTRMDRGWAVSVLAERRYRERRQAS